MEIPDLLSKNFKRLVGRNAPGDMRIHERLGEIEWKEPVDFNNTRNPYVWTRMKDLSPYVKEIFPCGIHRLLEYLL